MTPDPATLAAMEAKCDRTFPIPGGWATWVRSDHAAEIADRLIAEAVAPLAERIVTLTEALTEESENLLVMGRDWRNGRVINIGPALTRIVVNMQAAVLVAKEEP